MRASLVPGKSSQGRGKGFDTPTPRTEWRPAGKNRGGTVPDFGPYGLVEHPEPLTGALTGLEGRLSPGWARLGG